MNHLGSIALALLLLAGCGVSPELVDEPQVPETPAPSERADEDRRQSQDWQCAGSTAATRQQGRMARHRGIEGFWTRNCIAPATEVELNPNP